eukprot:TRINITY_DN5631_c0_g1_i2.p1 TRINITY_DN5631_c0_g1~~TRINITY_DN5631_c0_g1_i2.p1  ORF type:complete len:139 (-),score=44.81 TRINITY_DN5631_c0_g1_i2:224-640(-)
MAQLLRLKYIKSIKTRFEPLEPSSNSCRAFSKLVSSPSWVASSPKVLLDMKPIIGSNELKPIVEINFENNRKIRMDPTLCSVPFMTQQMKQVQDEMESAALIKEMDDTVDDEIAQYFTPPEKKKKQAEAAKPPEKGKK